MKISTEMAEVAASQGKSFCISLLDVGLDTTAVREAVLKVIELKVLPFPNYASYYYYYLFI